MVISNCFDNLSNELLFEIFDYLSFNDLIKSFFGLKQQLNNIIQAYPSKIDLSHRIDNNTFQYGSFCCQSLKIFGNDQHKLQMIISYLNFANLQAVTFSSMNLTNLKFLIEQLPMKQLESIIITDINTYHDPESIQQQIWLMIMTSGRDCLRYLDVPHGISKFNVKQMQFDLSVLERLIFRSISNNQTLALMHYTPNLYYCKIYLHDRMTNPSVVDVRLLKLSHVYLTINVDWLFEDFCRFFTISPHLKHLTVVLNVQEKCLDESSAWKTLIELYLPDLIYFYLHFDVKEYPDHYIYPRCNLSSFNNDEYWLQRRPQFQVTQNVQEICL
ncbi:unnamed protein product, partial [Rotaria sordida]